MAVWITKIQQIAEEIKKTIIVNDKNSNNDKDDDNDNTDVSLFAGINGETAQFLALNM